MKRIAIGWTPFVLALAACQSTHPTAAAPDSHDEPALIVVEQGRWTRIETPPDFNPSVLAATRDDSIFVGGDADPDGRSGPPKLLTIRNNGDLAAPINAQAVSYYGQRAEWGGLAVDAGTSEVFGYGQRRGGAHGNVRWSAWEGNLRGQMREQTQTFETFGGPKAGGIAAVVVAGDAPRLVGSWLGEAEGLDVAVWRLSGNAWNRTPSAGTVLASSETVQNSAQGAAARGAGIIIVGTVTTFADGKVTTKPGLWTSPSADGPWQSVDIPAPDNLVGQAQSALCDEGGKCLILGVLGGTLHGWTLEPDGPVVDASLPAILVESPDGLVAPSGPVGHRVAAIPAAGGESVLVVESAGSWRTIAGPKGTPLGIAEADGTVYVTVNESAQDSDAQPPSSLWSHVP